MAHLFRYYTTLPFRQLPDLQFSLRHRKHRHLNLPLRQLHYFNNFFGGNSGGFEI